MVDYINKNSKLFCDNSYVYETGAFSSAMSKWNRFKEAHPYLTVIPEV